MKKFISRYPGLVTGAAFTYGSLVINRTFIMPYFFTSFAPLIFWNAYEATGGMHHNYSANIFIFIGLAVVFFMVTIFYYTIFLNTYMINKLSFSGPLIFFMVWQSFLIHPFVLYLVTWVDWQGNPEYVPLFKTNKTFWLSSFSFIFFGLLADILRKRNVGNV